MKTAAPPGASMRKSGRKVGVSIIKEERSDNVTGGLDERVNRLLHLNLLLRMTDFFFIQIKELHAHACVGISHKAAV